MATKRPKEFDDRVMAYLPGLRRLAPKFARSREAQDDLVTDTIATALHRWRSFREDGGLWNWLSLTMRSTARDGRKKAARQIEVVDDATGFIVGSASVEANQRDYTELSATLAAMSGRDGTALLRRAMGYELAEIGEELGVSPERARQLVERERARLVRVAA